jgi:hypothetical protein
MIRRARVFRSLVALAAALAAGLISTGIALADGGIGPLPH